MFAFLPAIPGADDLRDALRRIDTARHHGVPDGCILELDLQTVPPESSGFDPLTFITGGGAGRCCCAMRSPRSITPQTIHGWRD